MSSRAVALVSRSDAFWICPIRPSILCIRSLIPLSIESLSETEHWRVIGLENLASADIHVHAARQARIKAAHGAHDVDTLELVGSVLFENRSVLHGVFVRARRPV